LRDRLGEISVDNLQHGEVTDMDHAADEQQGTAGVSMYSIDNIVRRAVALQQTDDAGGQS